VFPAPSPSLAELRAQAALLVEAAEDAAADAVAAAEARGQEADRLVAAAEAAAARERARAEAAQKGKAPRGAHARVRARAACSRVLIAPHRCWPGLMSPSATPFPPAAGMDAATEEVQRLKEALSSGARPASPAAVPAAAPAAAAAAPKRRPGRPRSTTSKAAAPAPASEQP
jgi:hypothetical protein